MSLEFLLVSLLVVASPGTGAALTVATGLSRGARTAAIAALGCSLGILPQFIAQDDKAPTLTMLALSAVFMIETLVVFAIYGAFAAHMRERVLGSPTVMNGLRRSFAATFVGLGIKLALTQR